MRRNSEENLSKKQFEREVGQEGVFRAAWGKQASLLVRFCLFTWSKEVLG